MSRATVRAAVAAWLTPTAVTNLAHIYEHPAKLTNEGDFVLPNGTAMGGIVFIQLEAHREKRIALGGPTSGIKWRRYQIVLVCLLRSASNLSQDAGINNDVFLDALVSRIQANRQLGTAGSQTPIFQAGEGDTQGGDDIEVQCGFPRPMDGGVTQVFSTVRFETVELIQT
jgi:hypothetical protein